MGMLCSICRKEYNGNENIGSGFLNTKRQLSGHGFVCSNCIDIAIEHNLEHIENCVGYLERALEDRKFLMNFKEENELNKIPQDIKEEFLKIRDY